MGRYGTVIFVGDDWAEAHHDVYLMDEGGARLASRRLPEGLEGMGAFHELVAGHASSPSEVAVGIETDRGLWVEAAVAAGYQVYAINPMAVSRYRDRHAVGEYDTGSLEVIGDECAVIAPHLIGVDVDDHGVAPEPIDEPIGEPAGRLLRVGPSVADEDDTHQYNLGRRMADVATRPRADLQASPPGQVGATQTLRVRHRLTRAV